MGGPGNPGRQIACRNGAVETNDFDRHLHSSKRRPRTRRAAAGMSDTGAKGNYNFKETFAADSLQVQQRDDGRHNVRL
jgi:hypothetical protein